MYKIIRPRGGGKTTTVMDMAMIDKNIVIVCMNPKLYEHLAEERGFNPTELKFISFSDFINLKGYSSENKYIIDEIDAFVQYIAQEKQVVAYTLSLGD